MDEALRELASFRVQFGAEFSQAFDGLEDRIERKLQQKFTQLQATSNATLREVQLIRKELTSSQQDVRLPSNAEGAGFAPWANPMHRTQSLSCRSEAGSAHIPSGPGPIAESLEIKETAASGILKKSAKKATQAPAGSKMSVTSSAAIRESKVDSKAHHVKFANTFDSLAGQQAKVRKLERKCSVLALEELRAETTELYRSFMKENWRSGPRYLWNMVKEPLHPEGNLRTRWDILLLLFLLYVCFTAPVMVCFDVNLNPDQPLWWFEIVVMVFFILDVVLNFNTAYRDHTEKLVNDRWRIAYNYAVTWFIIDLVAVIPFDYIQLQDDSADNGTTGGSNDVESVQLLKGLRLAKFTRILRVLRVVKLLRLLKILRLPGVMKRMSSVSGENTVKMTTLIGAAFLLLHLMACGFYYAAHMKHEDVLMSYQATGEWKNFTLDMQDEIQEASWRQTWVGYANLAREPKSTRYLTALYWSVYTLTTVGYGDVSPQNDYEKAVAMGAMVIGVTVFAYFMGNTASSIAAYNSQETAVSRAVNQMKDFMQARHVPKKLANKITTFYTMAARHQVLEDKSLTDALSVPLQTELMLFLYRKTLEKVPFFQGQDAQFITSVVSKLKMEYFAEDEVVVAEDDLGNVMYFVVNGLLEARHYSTPKEEWFEAIQQSITKEKELKQQADEEKGLVRRLTNAAKMRLPNMTAEEDPISRDWKFYPSAADLGEDYDIGGTIEEGEHFGEYSCLLGLPRTSTVVALEFCELYSLSQPDLIAVYKLWPDLHKEFTELVKAAEDALTEAENDAEEDLEDEPDRVRAWPPGDTGGNLASGGSGPRSSKDIPSTSGAVQSAEGAADAIPGVVPDVLLPVGGDEAAGGGGGGSGKYGIASSSGSQPKLFSVEEDDKTPLLRDPDGAASSGSVQKSAATAKMQRKAKMVMTMAKLGKDTANNPVFQLLSAGADAKQDRARNSLNLQRSGADSPVRSSRDFSSKT